MTTNFYRRSDLKHCPLNTLNTRKLRGEMTGLINIQSEHCLVSRLNNILVRFAPSSFRVFRVFSGLNSASSLLLILFLASATGALAQKNLDQQGPRPAPASVVQVAADKVTLQFPNTPVSDVLDIYERLIRKPLIRDSQVYRGPNVTLMPPEPVTKEDACSLIESALLINGYLLLPGPDGSIKVVLSDPKVKQNPLHEGITVYSNPDDLPAGDAIVGYFMHLDFLLPDDALALLSTHFQLNPYGKITPVYAPPSLLITENVSVIKQMIALKPMVDVDPALTAAAVKTELIEVKYADATQVASMISSLIFPSGNSAAGKSPAQASKPPQPRPASQSSPAKPSSAPRPAAIPMQAIKPASQNAGRQVLNQGQLLSINAQLIPDARTNKILLICDEASYNYIRKLIADLDQPLELTPPLERSLKYVAAGDVFPVLINMISDNGVVPPPTTTPGTQLPSQLGSGARPGVITGRSAASGASRGGSFTNASSSASSEPPDQLTDPSDDVSPLSTMIGKTRIVADRQANKIIIMGPPESYDRVTAILDKLDRKPPQVYLATIIGQLTLDDEHDVGVDYLLNFSKITSGALSADGLMNSVKDIRLGALSNAVPPMAGLTVFGAITNNIDVLARALESSHRFKIISRPTVYAANNKKAMITSGQEIPVPTEILTSLNSSVTSFNTNIAYRDVVLKLEVVPIINSNKEVTLRIAQINDTVVGQQAINSGTGTTSVPIIGTERLNTTVTIPNRQTVVLGGLISEQTNKINSGIPYLCRIPVLGKAFSSTKNSKTRTELMIFIQPVVVTDESELKAANRSEKARAKVSSDAAEIFPDNPLPVLEPGSGKSTKPIKSQH